jgi:hypothetical protein
MIVCLLLNYQLDFEDQYIDRLSGVYRWLGMLLFHSGPYLVVCLMIFKYTPQKWWQQKGFWLRVLLGFGILAFDRALQIQYFLSHLALWDAYYLTRVIGRLSSMVTVVLPLIMVYMLLDRNQSNRFYGLWINRFDPRPYLLLLGFAALGILIGGAFQDIQAHYPRYLEVGGPEFVAKHDIPSWLNVLIYEAAYGVNFISVEMFFRGFLIFAFSKYLGPYVVYPMIATYCFLHFGKPLTESVSSIFGGYILGVIAIHSRNIWGGVMLHVGLAWLMELVGYLYRIL